MRAWIRQTGPGGLKLFSILLTLILSVAGCREETFYGPYRLEIPTVLMEHTAGSTFDLPLDSGDLTERDLLERCQQQQPTTTCRCDYPVLTLYEHLIQLDYRTVLVEGTKADVLVWVGIEVESNEPDPEILPDLPRVEVIGGHYHSLTGQGQLVDSSFSETEMMDISLAYSLSRYAVCEQDMDSLPGLMEIMFGISLKSEGSARLTLDTTFRLREYK